MNRSEIQQIFIDAGYADTTAMHYAMRVDAWLSSKTDSTSYILAGRSRGTRRMRLCALKAWMSLPQNSAQFSAEITGLPRVKAPPLPPVGLLSEQDVCRWLSCIWNTYPRDYAVAVLAYSTGMRSSEISGMKIQDVDMGQRRITVRCGKGGRERVVPFGSNAHSALTHYMKILRPSLLKNDTDILFLNDLGEPLVLQSLRYRLQTTAKKVGLSHVRVGLHILRHACASHLRQRGMDLRHIQALLGHASIDDTARYLQFSKDEKAREMEDARQRIGRNIIVAESERLNDTA
jgi:site-specific recombinase XerD